MGSAQCEHPGSHGQFLNLRDSPNTFLMGKKFSQSVSVSKMLSFQVQIQFLAHPPFRKHNHVKKLTHGQLPNIKPK